MRRILMLLVPALIASGLYAGTQAPASAADPLTGKLVNISDPSEGLGGATVRLRTALDTGPGAVVVTDTTDSNGNFSLDAGVMPDDEYYVEVTKPDWQGGFIGGPPGGDNYVQPNFEFASTYGAHDKLGKVGIIPAFIRGFVVNPATGKRVRGIKVSVRSDDNSKFQGSDVTNSRGVFRIEGITCEDDCALKFVGHPKGYENGYRGCFGGVVPTWGDACASPIGNIGKVRIDHL